MNPLRTCALLMLSIGLLASFDGKAQQRPYVIKMHLDNNPSQCLDFTNGNLSNGVTLQVWRCNNNYENHHWWAHVVSPYYPGNSMVVAFQNFANGTCIAVEDNSLANGARLVQRACDSRNPSQQWIRLTRDGFIDRKSKYMNMRSGKCMDAPYASNGTVMQKWDCARASYWPQQMFRASLINYGGEVPVLP